MNAPTLRRICAQSGSSFGSNTTHWVPRKRLSSRNRAVRRTGMYFHSEASWSAPRSVRAPQTTRPATGKERRQFTPWGLSRPFSPSVRVVCNADTPTRVASSPAGAFHTPRCASVRTKMPATAPLGRKGVQPVLPQGVCHQHPGEENGRIFAPGSERGQIVQNVLRSGPVRGRVDNHHGPACGGVSDRSRPADRTDLGGAGQGWDAQEIQRYRRGRASRSRRVRPPARDRRSPVVANRCPVVPVGIERGGGCGVLQRVRTRGGLPARRRAGRRYGPGHPHQIGRVCQHPLNDIGGGRGPSKDSGIARWCRSRDPSPGG